MRATPHLIADPLSRLRAPTDAAGVEQFVAPVLLGVAAFLTVRLLVGLCLVTLSHVARAPSVGHAGVRVGGWPVRLADQRIAAAVGVITALVTLQSPVEAEEITDDPDEGNVVWMVPIDFEAAPAIESGDPPIMVLLEPEVDETSAPVSVPPDRPATTTTAPTTTAPSIPTPPTPTAPVTIAPRDYPSLTVEQSEQAEQVEQSEQSDTEISSPTAIADTVDDDRWVVQGGDHLWSIAADVVADALGSPPNNASVADYWVRLVEANRDRLPVADNVDLLFPGIELRLPAPADS